ncbi:methyltransferase [Pollutimonas harenae]|uniref:Class I SAM-dependent methyltransferase n=1 Tax=Pollutimonas harenae TaxID=657015 RepID=A0A853H4G9_9BURK|nr:class I SAM-dependent methyltransferase [Pollutimonas harenae]NYT86809.1 class I SAM-dependent methyltransferase [Pollutimonas harenae]TEA71455.1 class I SAM-dependent methyltransferase [Pollutimonas harenae]
MPIAQPPAPSVVSWMEHDDPREALWLSDTQGPVPSRLVIANDTLSADAAYRLISQGTSLLWRGDFQNARQLLQALARRIDNTPASKRKRKIKAEPTTPHDLFNRHRQQQSQRTALLNRLLIELDAQACIHLKRAPLAQEACHAALGDVDAAFLLPLRALQGLIGAHEWRKKGVAIPGLPGNIHVHYGVFSPNRGEYIDLVAQAPLPATDLAFDIGTGSGVLAAVLAQRGVRKVMATDLNPKALACARENIDRLGFGNVIELLQTDLFPTGKSSLIICNPPWLPARPTTAIEHAIYDPDNQMLLGYLQGLPAHLRADGEGWLIMSDLAEHLGLRSHDFLPKAIANAGLRVIEQHTVKPRHRKATDPTDLLHQARQAEVTSLWRLALTKQHT